MGYVTPIILGIAIAFACRFSFYALYLSDFYKVAHKHEPGKCVPVAGITQGAENFQLIDNGIVITTSGLNWLRTNTPYHQTLRGRLMLIDLNAAIKAGTPPVAKELALPAGFDATAFNPHGLSAWPVQKPTSSAATQKLYRLYIANHRHNTSIDFIEVFEFDAVAHKIIRHVRSISGPNIRHVNDIDAVGEDRFFFTNDFSGPTDTLRHLELYLILPTGSVGYYDGQNATLLEHTLLLPNGIAVHDGNLYVVESSRKTVRMYYISSATPTPTLRLLATHHIGSLGDNVWVDADGDLWIGAHPVGWQLVMGMSDPAHKHAPSQVLRVKLSQDGLVSSTREIFADDGTQLSASSAALLYNRHVLIGTINHKALWCECTLAQCMVKDDFSPPPAATTSRPNTKKNGTFA